MRTVLMWSALMLTSCSVDVEPSEAETSEEPTVETSERLGTETPQPRPFPGESPGHDMGGPGHGWGGGYCSDPQYASACNPPQRPSAPGGMTREQRRTHEENQRRARIWAAYDARDRIERRGEVILQDFERKRGKGVETDRAACLYACRTTSRELCYEVRLACVGVSTLYWIPEVPISCAAALLSVCGGSIPVCHAGCYALSK